MVSVNVFHLLLRRAKKKKKFKKCILAKRRVERRAINPADPNLDPKKMTMKDIIRLAEAKEKMLKKDDAKAKDATEKSSSVPEQEQENNLRTSFAPQVQIIDGRIVINQESLTVTAHPKDDIRNYRRVEETHSKLNYHSYMKKTPKLSWRKEETELFYKALREFGTNFAMIQHLFPGRTRKQVFLKYKKEERSCPLRVSEAMTLKPSEYSHYMEVMNLMNLLPNKSPDTPESQQASMSFDMASNREETEDGTCTLVRGSDRPKTDGDSPVFKPGESPKHSENRKEKNGNDGSNQCGDSEAVTSGKPDETQNLESQELPKPDELPKPCESPKKEPTPPRKRSLFSYQTSSTKSLFSYQQHQ